MTATTKIVFGLFSNNEHHRNISAECLNDAIWSVQRVTPLAQDWVSHGAEYATVTLESGEVLELVAE